MLPFDKEIRWIQESADTDRHVVIQEIGGLRYLQIGRCLLVLEFEFQFPFEEKPIRQLPEENGIECSIKKRVLTAAGGKSGSAVASEQKLCRSGKCFLYLQLERLDFLTQFLRSGFRRHGDDLFPFANGFLGRGFSGSWRCGSGHLLNRRLQCVQLLLHRLVFCLELVVLSA